jgi:hypothetical protein
MAAHPEDAAVTAPRPFGTLSTEDDPLADHTPDWRERLADEQEDLLAGYTPDWRERLARSESRDFTERVMVRAAKLGYPREPTHSPAGEEDAVARYLATHGSGDDPVARYLTSYGGDPATPRDPSGALRVEGPVASSGPDSWGSWPPGTVHTRLRADHDRAYERYVPTIEATRRGTLGSGYPRPARRAAATSQRFGDDLTTYSGSVGGDYLSGMTQSLGDLSYTNLLVGRRSVSATTLHLGAFDFTTTSEGQSYTSQHLGGLTFTTGSDGFSATSQRIGDLTLTMGSGGLSPMSQRLGSFEYTSIRRPR